MQQSDSKSIRQMLQDPDLTIEDLLDREDLSSDVRNLSLQFTNMLNYENMKKIMQWLIKQGPQDTKHSYKFPLVASEIVAIQTPNINQHLFVPGEERQPLFEYLYQFTQEKDNYVLAGYFSKVLIAIIKRHTNSQYTDVLCNYFFEQQYLDKLINHLYSTSTIDLILRVFTLRTKANDYYEEKKRFVIKVLQLMDQDELSDEIVENVVFFIQALLLYEPNSATPLAQSNSGNSPNKDIKQIPFEDMVIMMVFSSLGNTNRIRKSKAKIVNLYLVQFRVTDDFLLYRQVINTYVDLITTYLKQKSISKSKVSLEETYILDNLHSILQFPIQTFVTKAINCIEGLFDLITINGWNNIFHQQILKIINILLTKSSSKNLIKALIDSLVKFTEISAQHYSHQVGYTEFILKITQEVINVCEKNQYEETQQWVQFAENVRDIVQTESEYSVGDYVFKPHTIAFAYSKQNALKQYAQFLGTPTLIIYETKQEPKKQQVVSNKTIPEPKPKQQIVQHYLVLPRTIITTGIETSINESATEDSEMLQNWRQRIDYSLEDLINDI